MEFTRFEPTRANIRIIQVDVRSNRSFRILAIHGENFFFILFFSFFFFSFEKHFLESRHWTNEWSHLIESDVSQIISIS